MALTVEERVTNLEGGANGIAGRVTTLEASVAALETAVATNSGDVAALAVTVTGLASSLSDVSGLASDLELSVGTALIYGSENAAAIAALPDHSLTIATNVAAIAANAAAIASNPDNTSVVSANVASISANVSAIVANTAAIAALDTRLQVLEGICIGCMVTGTHEANQTAEEALATANSLVTAFIENDARITALESVIAPPAPDLSGIAANTAALSAYIVSNDFEVMLLNELWGTLEYLDNSLQTLTCAFDPTWYGVGEGSPC